MSITSAPKVVNVREDQDIIIPPETEEILAESSDPVDAPETESPTPPVITEDPRMAIAAKHDQKHRKFGKESVQNELNSDIGPETMDSGLVSVKVNGTIREVEQERIDKAGGIQAYQKEMAVSQGFQDIAARTKELDRRAEALVAQEYQIAAKKALPPPDEPVRNDPPAKSGDHKKLVELVKYHREALLDGDDEAADEAMTQLLTLRDATPVATKETKDEVDAREYRAAERAAQLIETREYSKQVYKARDVLFTAHPDVKSDPRLFELVDMETDVVRRANPEFTPQEILDTAYENVMDWRGTTRGPTASMTTKAEEKRVIARPVAGTGRFQGTPPAQHETRSEYVKRIAQSRGQL